LLLTSRAIPHAAESTDRPHLALTRPLDYQVYQRATRAKGNITMAGNWPDNCPEGASLEARVAGAGVAAEWQRLAVHKRGEKEFRGELSTPAGGWYRLEVRLIHGGNVAAETTVEHVGVGEIFVISGQSNSANHGEEKQRTRTRLVAAFHDGKWQVADDPQPGASGNGGSFIPPFADAIAERFKVPIGIVAAGVGATSIREWLPRGTQFPNPPTLTRNVRQLPSGQWESKGAIFEDFTSRLRQLGPNGFRAVLWHQGESDANQKDPSRTLPGALYKKFVEQLIRDSRREAGWEVPWFVAQASYHGPEDTGSADIRAAQRSLWSSGIALEGPDTDALMRDLRDQAGKGVHFSGKGLREHGARWAEKVSSWLDRQLASAEPKAVLPVAKVPGPSIRLGLPGEDFMVAGRPAFVLLPSQPKEANPQPWIFYAPTLPSLPDQA